MEPRNQNDSQTESSLARLGAQMESVISRLDTIQAELARHNDRLDAIQAESTRHGERLDAVQTELGRIQTELARHRDKEDEIRDDIRRVESDANEFRAWVRGRADAHDKWWARFIVPVGVAVAAYCLVELFSRFSA